MFIAAHCRQNNFPTARVKVNKADGGERGSSESMCSDVLGGLTRGGNEQEIRVLLCVLFAQLLLQHVVAPSADKKFLFNIDNFYILLNSYHI